MSLPSQAAKQKRPLITGWGIAGLVVVAVAWFFGIGDSTPSRQQADKFLAWGLKWESDGMPGFRDDGTKQRLKQEMVKGTDEVECYRDAARRSLFQRFSNGFKRYDCIYRLAGSAGERYLAVISATYVSRDMYDMAQVDPYMLTFWAAEPDQRRILAENGISLPKPAN
jgi:hypothetical protein